MNKYFILISSLYIAITSLRTGLNLHEVNDFMNSILFHYPVLWFFVSIIALLFAIGMRSLWLGVLLLIICELVYDQTYLVVRSYIGFLILAFLVNSKSKKENRFFNIEDPLWDKDILNAIWIIILLSYSVTGIDRVFTENWYSGDAIYNALNVGFASPWLIQSGLLESIPKFFFKMATYIAIFMEVAAILFFFHKTTRILYTFFWLGAHLLVLISFRIEEVSLVMLFVHIFLLLNPTDFKFSKMSLRDTLKLRGAKLFALGFASMFFYIVLGNGEKFHMGYRFFVSPCPAAFTNYEGHNYWNHQVHFKFYYENGNILERNMVKAKHYTVPQDIHFLQSMNIVFYAFRMNNGNIRNLLCKDHDILRIQGVETQEIKKVELLYKNLQNNKVVNKDVIFCYGG